MLQQYQIMMSSVARVKFIKTKVIYQTKFHHIRITKSKVIHVQIPVPKWEKTKKVGENFLDYKTE